MYQKTIYVGNMTHLKYIHCCIYILLWLMQFVLSTDVVSDTILVRRRVTVVADAFLHVK